MACRVRRSSPTNRPQPEYVVSIGAVSPAPTFFAFLRRILWLALACLLPAAALAQTLTDTFNSSGTWTAPAGVTSINVVAWGAGGGGADDSMRGGGGGGSGAFASATVTVVPGTTYAVTVGTGGASGAAGGASSFGDGSQLLARGGSGATSDTGAAAGLASTSVGSVKFNGCAGGNGQWSGPSRGGGGGGGSPTSAGACTAGASATGGTGAAGGTGLATGGSGGNDGASGAAGGAPGSGGGGAGRNSSAAVVGGSGANGRVTLSYTIPPQLVSDYRFDECTQYTGAAGQVLDSVGSYPATPSGGLQNATPGQILRYADFSAAARYAEAPVGPTLNTSWTLSGWFKTPFATSATHSSQYYVLGSVSGGGDYLYLDRAAGYRWGVYTTAASDSAGVGGTSDGTYQFGSLSNGWHHITLVGSGNTTRLYIDGVYRDQVNRRVKGTFRYFGASYDSRGTPSGQSFGTPLDEFKVFSNPLDAAQIAAIYANESAGNNWNGSTRTNPCLPTIDHVEMVHDGAALTCTPKAVTVLACTTAASCYGVAGNQYTAGTFSISPTAIAGAQWCSDSLCATTLTSPATLSNGSLIYLKDTNVRTDRIGGTTSSASNATMQCFNTTNSGFNATTACDIAFAASGFLVSLPHHVSCSNATLTVQAVQSSNNATNCVPMFRNQTRTETISFAYSSPATGTRVPTVAGTAISTGGTGVSLSFDNSGIATPTFVYQDAGRLSIAVADPSLPMTGTTSTLPVIAPAGFAFSGIPAAPLTAGQAFNTTITAMNACSTPAATPNFTATTTLASSNPQPGMGNATAINTTVSGFTGGAASTNLTWNEVGTIDLAATASNYLGSGLNVSGSQAAVGRFKPAYFDTFVTPGAGTFTYAGLVGPPVRAGQPFTVEVKAKRFGGDATDATNTANYAGATWAKLVMLSDAGGGSGTFANNTLAATAFASGKASRADVAYSFASKLTAPYTLVVRAIDADTPAVSSSGHTEGSTPMRSGRLRLINAYGSELLAPRVEYRAEYWDGSRWATNSLDGTTAFAAGNIATGGLTVNAVGTIAAGIGFITFNTAAAGSYDIAVNLNTSGSDTSCNAAHGGTAASRPWLQGFWAAPASCGGTAAWAQDPNARVRLGTSKTPLIYLREQY